VNRNEVLTAASTKLTEVAKLLAAAGEDRLAANVEDLVQEVELIVIEGKTPPNATSH
jgi:hypothetical protein